MIREPHHKMRAVIKTHPCLSIADFGGVQCQDTDTFALDDDDDDDGPGGLPPSAVGLPLVDPTGTETEGEGIDLKDDTEAAGGDPDVSDGAPPPAIDGDSEGSQGNSFVVLEGGVGAANQGRK